MQLVEIGTDHVPSEDRFDYWRDQVFQSHTRSELRTDRPRDFRARTLSLDLGPVRVSALACPSLHADRHARLIRQSDPEVVLLHLPRIGGGRVSQGGRESEVTAGDIVLYDSSRPLHVQMLAPPNGLSSFLLVEVSRQVLQPLVPSISELTGVPLCGRTGVGAVLSRYLDEMLRNAQAFQPVEAASLTGVTIDLIATACAGWQAHRAPPLTNCRQTLYLQIVDFIRQHLADPALCPESIAAVHHISIRQLHKLFQAQGELTVTASIRRSRLERCRRDLMDPRYRSRTVRAIAERWGFSDRRHFSRLFSTAFGAPPGDYRKHQLDMGSDYQHTRDHQQ